MAVTPAFTSTPRLTTSAVSTANTNRDGTGTIVSLMTGAAAGTKVFEVDIQWTVTSTAGMLRLYLSVDGGSTWKLFDEQAVTAITASASVACFRAVKTYTNLVLRDSSCAIGASTHNAEASVVTVLGGDLT